MHLIDCKMLLRRVSFVSNQKLTNRTDCDAVRWWIGTKKNIRDVIGWYICVHLDELPPALYAVLAQI